ncbi:hypothetical protein RUM43_008960 [Polyplax serrata]|uniref:Agouti domain-containing protein n=1 Tax=Polyplax serrata TaxID=468196 RepID=A0AAN8PHA8_POLSC
MNGKLSVLFVCVCIAAGLAVASSQLISTGVFSPVSFSGPRIVAGPFLRVMTGQTPAFIDSDGPDTPPLPVLQAPSITLPTVEGPVVALPSPPIPAPRVLSSRCICTKTVVKPQIIQRSITIPKIHRYIKRTYTPVIEKIAYKARPKSSSCKCCSGCVCNKCNSGCCTATGGCCVSSKVC